MNTSIFGKLKLWQSFLVLCVIGLLLASIPSVLYLREMSIPLAAYRAEQQGLPAVASSMRLIQLVQQHRGLSALVLGGGTSNEDQRAGVMREADQTVAAVDAVVSGTGDADIVTEWSGIKADWATLRSGVGARSLTLAQSFTRHTELIAKLLRVNELAGDFFGLSLDPEPDTYQLNQSMYYQLPFLTEAMGQLRGKGAGLLAKHEASPEERLAVSSMVARVADRLGQTSNAFNKAAARNPELARALGPTMEDVRTSAATLVRLASDEIVKPEALTFAGPEYFATATRAIDSEFQLNKNAGQLLQTMLDGRIQVFQRTRALMIAAMLVLVAVAGYLAMLITRAVTVPLNHAISVAHNVAEGNLTNDIAVQTKNEVGQMLGALKTMNDSLRGIVGGVRASIDTIGAATRDIASGNNDVSARLENQASNLEETASSMEELTSTVRQNADNARQANELVRSASGVAEQGGAVVAQVVQTMAEINDGARKIADIIGVIDAIAFQTNILALNAAVEAARAGEQGRGFAVVASEVRNLAQRSATAAREIKDVISDSVQRVAVGNDLASQAGVAMANIVSSVERITTIMAEIAVASAQQGSGIEQVNLAVTQMDDMTQQNAALVEQTAAASSSLEEQAASLVSAMSIFTLGNEARTGAPRLTRDAQRPLRAALR